MQEAFREALVREVVQGKVKKIVEASLRNEGRTDINKLRYAAERTGRGFASWTQTSIQDEVKLEQLRTTWSGVCSDMLRLTGTEERAEVLMKLAEGMGLSENQPKVDSRKANFILRLTNLNSKQLDLISLVPGLRALDITTFYLLGFTILSGYDEAEETALCEFTRDIVKAVPEDKRISIPLLIAKWLEHRAEAQG